MYPPRAGDLLFTATDPRHPGQRYSISRVTPGSGGLNETIDQRIGAKSALLEGYQQLGRGANTIGDRTGEAVTYAYVVTRTGQLPQVIQAQDLYVNVGNQVLVIALEARARRLRRRASGLRAIRPFGWGLNCDHGHLVAGTAGSRRLPLLSRSSLPPPDSSPRRARTRAPAPGIADGSDRGPGSDQSRRPSSASRSPARRARASPSRPKAMASWSTRPASILAPANLVAPDLPGVAVQYLDWNLPASVETITVRVAPTGGQALSRRVHRAGAGRRRLARHGGHRSRSGADASRSSPSASRPSRPRSTRKSSSSTPPHRDRGPLRWSRSATRRRSSTSAPIRASRAGPAG